MYENHAFFREINKGPCRKLRGNVFVEMVFVEDQVNTWTKEEIDAFYPVYKRAAKRLCKDALASGVELSFTTVISRHRWKGKLDPNRFHTETLPQLRMDYYRSLGYGSPEEYMAARKRQYRGDEVAMFFVLERSFRAYACNGPDVEFCVMTNENDEHAVAHELLHLFGAADLYYPYHVYGLTMEYFPKSIMCTYEGMEVDPVTRYLVGWDRKLSPKAEEYLYKLREHTTTRFERANALEFYRYREAELLPAVRPFASVAALARAVGSCDPWAEFLLGLCYLHGIQVQKNHRRAEELFRLSGRAGLEIGAVQHAQMLFCRDRLTPEEQEELRLILYYNSSFHVKLDTLLLLSAFTGIGGNQNKKWAVDKAIALYKGEGLHLEIAQRSAHFYKIAEKYSEKIPELLRVVCRMKDRYDFMMKNRDPDLYYFIARLMEEGVHLQKDPKGAFTLYKIAAEEAHPAACSALARCYDYGIGTARNPREAAAARFQSQLFIHANPYDPYYKWMQ